MLDLVNSWLVSNLEKKVAGREMLESNLGSNHQAGLLICSSLHAADGLHLVVIRVVSAYLVAPQLIR